MNQNTFNLAVALGMVVADANVGYKFVVGHKSLGKIQRTASGKAKKENRQKKKAANESRRINRYLNK